MTKTCLALAIAAALTMLTGCATPPTPQQAVSKADCGVGGSSRGIAAGLFALFQDRPECF